MAKRRDLETRAADSRAPNPSVLVSDRAKLDFEVGPNCLSRSPAYAYATVIQDLILPIPSGPASLLRILQVLAGT